MKQFWHSDITDKSFQSLIKLNQEFNFILIGGWAVYFWTKKMKSKDIDIVVDFAELGKIREKHNLVKNNRLRKYEINFAEFDVDIYLPHYSKIGFPLDKLKNYIQNIEGFKVPQIEILLFLKLFVYQNRKNSLKGEKDKVDIISLLNSVEIDWKKFIDFCQKNKIDLTKEIKEILNNTPNTKELNINNRQMAKLRKNVLGELSKNSSKSEKF